MNNNQHGANGQPGIEEIFRPLVENTPQIPVDKLVYQVKVMNKRLKKYVAHLREERKAARTILREDSQKVSY